MAAPNKQQALAAKKRTTNYGSEPGEKTQGLKPGDRYYDADTNTWQLKDGASADDDVGGIADYIGEVMDASGMNGNVQRSSQGNAGTGSSGSKSSQADADADDASGQDTDQDGDGNWIIPAAIAAGGATAIAAWIAKRKGGKGKQSTVSSPASDTAGEADKGGPSAKAAPIEGEVLPPKGTDILQTQAPYTDSIIDAIYSQDAGQQALPPPARALPAPVDGMQAIPMGSQPAASVQNPDAQGMLPPPPKMDMSAVDQMINASTNGEVSGIDPETERGLQDYAARIREQMQVDPYIMDKVNQGTMGDMPTALQRRLRAILASGV